MPDTPPKTEVDVKTESSDSQATSQPLHVPDEKSAKRPRLDTDGHGPTLSSSYRPRKRPSPLNHVSISSPSLSSSSSSNFQSEHIVTPLSSSSTSTGVQQNNHYRPTSIPHQSSSSIPAPSSSLASRWSHDKFTLPPPPPIAHSLPPRPQVSLPPPSPHNVGQTSELAAVPISSASQGPSRGANSVKSDTETTSTSPPPDPPSAEEIRRRADEVIARLMGTAPTPSSTTLASAPSSAVEGSLGRKAEDVIARLERETRAREAALPAGTFRPHHPPPHGLPGRPPVGYYPSTGMMPPRPPPGWRPPVGYGPPPGWRPPGPIITRFPRPPPALPLSPPAHLSPYNMSPPNLPPSLPTAVPPVKPATSMSSPSILITPLPDTSTTTPNENDVPVLLPRKRKSESADPPVQPKSQNQVYIGNLPATTQLATLRKAFEALSPILTIELRAPYAMIEFEEDGMAQQAVEAYDEGTFGGVQIRVERASD